MPRLHSFDYIRVIALFGILTCHSLFLFEECVWLGRYFAQCFNFIFLILSAFLIGLSWEKYKKASYSSDFIKHRFSKLTWTYYPFLIILFVFLAFMGESYSLMDIVMYASYLAWFDKIPGFGHVWFLTMMAFAYSAVFFYSIFHNSRLKENTFGNRKQWIKWLMLGMTVIILHTAITRMNLPGYMILYLALYLIVFRYSGTILNKIGEFSLWTLVIMTIIFHFTSLIAYNHGLFENMYVSPIIGIINGITLFALLFKVFQSFRPNPTIAFVSGISFETYLLHEFFIYNRGFFNLNYPPHLTT